MRALCVFVVATLVVCAPLAAVAQDKGVAPQVNVTGTWAGEIKTVVSYSPITVSFKLDQKPDGVSGFAWPGEGQVPIKNVKRDANRLAFDISGSETVYRFDLVVSADRMEGDVSATDHGHAWTGKVRLDREKPKENGKK